MIAYRVTHRTVYHYESPVSSSYGQLCLLPRSFPGQTCRTASVSVDPGPTDARERTDFFGNRVGFFHVERAHEVLTITATSEVEIEGDARRLALEANRPLGEVVEAMTRLDGTELVEAACHLLDTSRTGIDDRVRAYAAESHDLGRPVVDCLRHLIRRIHHDFGFEPEVTEVTSTVADLFDTGAGVCQDFAHLAVAACRAWGLPARYVSGYLETDPPPGKPKLVGADVSHAWAAVFVPGAGWIDIDPTNDQFVNERYITVAWGRDYDDVAPIKGVIYSDSPMSELDVSVDVALITP